METESGYETIIGDMGMSTIQNADTINVLKNGKVVESGTHEQLIDLGGEYYKLYQRQEEK